jgi:hypothetical protein
MGFFSGRVSFVRFRIAGPSPGMFGPEHLERLQDHAIGKSRLAGSDGVEVGWTAGEHILDTTFELAKNIVEDTLHFSLRIDTNKLPADLLRAYYQVDLAALAATNPSGQPSQRQKKEAKESARQRLENQASDGRFLRRKAYPLLWDARSNELLAGTTSAGVVERLHTLFQQTFGQKLEMLTAGVQAFRLAELRSSTRGVDDASPSAFLPGLSTTTVEWCPDETSRDFLGNEFLLWLWYMLDNEGDTITLSDKTEVALMIARTLVLECPRGQTGRETISSEGPSRLPEARRAIQAGKLPRRLGLTLIRHDHTYDLTWTAENLAVTAARLPAPEESEERARLVERVAQLRHLLETLDLLFDAFVAVRTSDDWSQELGRIQQWLQREERNRLGAAG